METKLWDDTVVLSVCLSKLTGLIFIPQYFHAGVCYSTRKHVKFTLAILIL